MVQNDFLKQTASFIVNLEEQILIFKEEIKGAYQEAKLKKVEVDVLKKVISDRIKGVSPDQNQAKHDLYKKYVEAVY